jgi:cellulose synthase/poly-beta-1,6-N-acetylglucosamine synthase-like glycosyltransferase
MLVIFWAAIAVIVYIYVIFPLLIVLRGALFPRRYKQADITPHVSLVIAAYNEARDIGEKLENILALDYPRELLDVVIASDGSSDATNEIVAAVAEKHSHIRLLALPRQGKAGALNDGVAASTGEILVFSDGNSKYLPDAIRKIVRPFADTSVGGVAGNQRYLPPTKEVSNAGETSYWSFDRILKVFESRGGNVISATGAIYAIRRSLFHGVPEGVTDDFTTSTKVIAQGYRLVFAEDAVALEPVAKSVGLEYGRKVRVMTRGLNAVVVMRELLNPFKYGFYALQLFSHKVLRRLVFVPMIVLLIVTPFLWNEGWFYQLALIAQVAFYGLAILGAGFERVGKKLPKVAAIPFFVTMVYTAAMIATWNVLTGRQVKSWKPQRS